MKWLTFMNLRRLTKKHPVASFILGVFLSELLIEIAFHPLIEKLKFLWPPALNALAHLLAIKVPVYSLILTLLLIWGVYKLFWRQIVSKSKLRIIKATYGKNGRFVDITDALNRAVENDRLHIVLNNNIAGDPIVGIEKEGRVEYEYKGRILVKVYKENEIIDLPGDLGA